MNKIMEPYTVLVKTNAPEKEYEVQGYSEEEAMSIAIERFFNHEVTAKVIAKREE